MLRSDLVTLLEECCEMDHATADDVLTVVFDGIIEALHNGDEVNVMGFGKFTTEVRESRPARNPKTGEAVITPAKRIVRFAPGSSLKRALAVVPDGIDGIDD